MPSPLSIENLAIDIDKIARKTSPVGNTYVEVPHHLAVMAAMCLRGFADRIREGGPGSILSEIVNERANQDDEWGGPDQDDQRTSWDWIAYLTKHAGKAVRYPFDLEIFRRQMVRVAALAVAAIEWADRLKKRQDAEEEAGIPF